MTWNILWNSMTSTSSVFTELANAMKYGGGFLYNLVFNEWRHCVSQNEVLGRLCYITLFSPSDVTAFHRITDQCQTWTLYRNIGENVLANRILKRSDLSNQYQSTYNEFRSTETALKKVEKDIILNIDEGSGTALPLLDLSAAFHTLDHRSVSPISCQLDMLSMVSPLSSLFLTRQVVNRRWI